MIDKTQLDGPLSVIYFHNVKRNQPFDTEWISDLSEEKIREIVMLLEADGYITYHVAKKEYHESYMCTLTNKGIQFCNAGGYKKQKSNELKKNNFIGNRSDCRNCKYHRCYLANTELINKTR